MVKPLTIYKASAGSGKTFTLATEYIKLLVDNPQAYRQTLAVTFTNKATEEMKMRILSKLYGIWRQLDDAADYRRKVCQDLQLSPDVVSQRAGEALHLLLHDYSYFRVETIDAFFNSVLRNLARELDLTANLRVTLNDYQIEEQAIDQLIDSLTVTDKLLQWILRYIMDNIEEDRSWNVISQIKKFGRSIFSDKYKQHSSDLHNIINQEGFFESFTKQLKALQHDASERMKQIAETFFDTISGAGLTVDDFSGKSRGVCSIFIKLQRGDFDESIITKTVADAVGNPAKWYTKSSPNAAHIHSLADGELDSLLRNAIEQQPRQWRIYKSAELTLRHISQLRLLEHIDRKVHQLNTDSGNFLLSDTQHLLQQLISDSDSPFIFEKIGTQLEHIMIDEFQDTSTVQWKNFKLLLQETMSHSNSSNIIVGDVKQSIYRWRSGDWRLLANIASEFPSSEQLLHFEPLATNWRSARRIVEFNNAFFTKAAQAEEVSAYDDVTQKIPSKRGDSGYVEINLLSTTDGNCDLQMLEMLALQVRTLIERGARPTDIAILVRANNHIQTVADYFMEHVPDVTLVSDEAFRLDASPAVQAIVQALQYLSHPDDDIAKAYVSKIVNGRPDGPLPPDFTPELLRMPLYDLAERLYTMLNLSQMKGQSAYLCAFYDCLSDYITDGSGTVRSFLAEWTRSISGKSIQSPDMNGVRIISIHKSKGLEFPFVLIPFCDWQLEHRDILWCADIADEPFSRLPLIPVDFSEKGMAGTVFEHCYDEEHQQNIVDNLNLLYVAFTRAADELYVYGRRGSKATRSALIEQVLPDVSMLLTDSTLSGADDDKQKLTFTFGTAVTAVASGENAAAREVKPVENPFLVPPTPLNVDIEVHPQKVYFRQSNRSRDFVSRTDDDAEPSSTDYIQLGSVLHEVFSTIRTTSDADEALRRLELEGIVYSPSMNRRSLEDMIRKRLSNPRVAQWFDPKWTLYNECTILSTDPSTGKMCERRPDRVMTDGHETIVVDFKFGRERSEYHAQVAEYMTLLRTMGHARVSGFLWYVYSNKIVEVRA